MITCTFELNNLPMSELKFGVISFPAFSGMGSDKNRRTSMCAANLGPIPVGSYYIFDWQNGGRLGAFKEWVRQQLDRGKSDWFALYAIDEKVDDEMLCNQIKRGNFRLHPKGPGAISKGCVTIENRTDWYRIRSILKASQPVTVPGTDLKAYGRLLGRVDI